jgi:hypothetical protein
MAKNDLVRLRPRDVAKVWGTAFGQLIDLWIAAQTALTELGSGEQPIDPNPSDRFRVSSVDGRMPRLIARDLVGESFHKPLDGRAVIFTQTGSGQGFVEVECSVDETFQRITGDIYGGEVVNEDGKVVAMIRLDAGS